MQVIVIGEKNGWFWSVLEVLVYPLESCNRLESVRCSSVQIKRQDIVNLLCVTDRLGLDHCKGGCHWLLQTSVLLLFSVRISQSMELRNTLLLAYMEQFRVELSIFHGSCP